MGKSIRRIAIPLGLLASQGLHACDNVPAVAAAWFKANHASVSVSAPGSSEKDAFTFDIATNGDLRIDASGSSDGSGRGSLMLVSGSLLVKDLALTADEEIDAIDAPVILLQLANKLLAEGTKRKPSELKGKLKIDVRENARSVCAATPSAEAEYAAPWTLRGDVDSKSAGIVDFSLKFSFANQGKTQEILYAGQWAQSSTPVVFADSVSIEGWKVFTLGPVRRVEGASTILDYGATADSKSYKTLGELRAAQKARATEPHKLPNH